MTTPLRDYAMIGDCRTAALVSLRGSIDWLCLPRFDSPSVFAALVGRDEGGCWELHPVEAAAIPTRHYDADSFTLVTRWECSSGVAEVRDVMPIAGRTDRLPDRADLIRRVVGVAGEVRFVTRLRMRLDYARAIPWVRQTGTADAPETSAVAGADALVVRGVQLHPDGLSHVGHLTTSPGTRHDLTLGWHPSSFPAPAPLDVDAALEATADAWRTWAASVSSSDLTAQVRRSLLVLRALTHRDTGGIVAAATTSLPEQLGGSRNWDYRYVWLRDASLTLRVMISHKDLDEVEHWRLWLLRAIAGDPAQMQIVYGVAGERRLDEYDVPGLSGYADSRPVRIGNAAVAQYQADVVGEVLVALRAAREAGMPESPDAWSLQRALLARTIERIDDPDSGIWEMRGPLRHFTQSRAMIWAALDCGVSAVREGGQRGDADLWERTRDDVRRRIDDTCVAAGGWFTQYAGTDAVDASLLLLPQVGYCAYDDPRMLATVERIEQTLLKEGLVLRYRSDGQDGLTGHDNPFLACSFWLAQQYAMSGRLDDARELFDRAAGAANDLGLLTEEYDVEHGLALGNLPQALSHLALVQAADAVSAAEGRLVAVDAGGDTPTTAPA